jgi:chemotaxis protein histidine kinase CheA/ActR/RegA family two-component response regulator
VKLNDLIEALAEEIERTQPELNHYLDQLAVLDVEADGFMDALDQYSSQAQRMGEAAEMAGFPGLQAVCAHVSDNTLLAAVFPPAERGPLIQFLRRWPALIVHHLRNMSDPSASAGLIDHLLHAPNPLGDDQALRIAHMLGATDGQLNTTFGELEDSRPVLATAADVALDLPDDVDPKMMEGFFSEAPDQARYLVQLAQNLVSGEGDSSDIIAAKRVMHTLKGSGAIIGLRGLASLGHHSEDILEHLERSGVITKPVADVLLDAAYCLEQMVGYVLGADDPPQQAQMVLQSVLDLANRIDRGEDMSEPTFRATGFGMSMMDQIGLGAAARTPPVLMPDFKVEAPALPEQQQVKIEKSTPNIPATASPTAALRVPVERVDELFRLSGEVSVHTAAMEARLKTLADAARALLAQNLRVQKRLFELETVVDVRALTTARARGGLGMPANDANRHFDPLEMDQYSELHSTTHALMEEAADARTLAGKLNDEIGLTVMAQAKQQRLSKDLQHLVISTRMTEVGVLASRLQRNVRSTCQATGKLADLIIEGSTTLIDGDVLNRLADPLLHLLRNAVDHGLETPAERLAAGKFESGRIVLSFARQGHQVVLNCRDDGRGLDHVAIRNRAIERGLLAADQVVNDEELARMILMSGFSTRQTINELSGRGVGLDVVREWAASMNGSIKVTSGGQGVGCTIELRFAASLSTMQALVVGVGDQRFALPSVQIERAIARGVGHFARVAEKMLYHYTSKSGEKVHAAQFLSVLAGLPHNPSTPLENYDAVLVRVEEKTYALAVEQLLDARELLVKNPGRYAKHVLGVAGLSILGDGSIAVNLDLSQLLAQGGRKAISRASVADTAPTALPERERKLPSVLIVDDALSVRNSLLQLVQDAGFRATTARDGLDAVDVLSDFKPDIVLTDLEMPNMNGVELTAYIRGREEFKGLPVIMITSRSQEKHRRMAEQAGVSTYLTKPYNDVELLHTIRSMLGEKAAVAEEK